MAVAVFAALPARADNADTMLMLQAAQSAAQRDFSTANSLYSQIIARHPNNIDAYVQRSLIRREGGDLAGSLADATFAAGYLDHMIAENPQNARLYYLRGNAYRLMRNFPQAKADLETAIQMQPGQYGWLNDLKAIEFESKTDMAQRMIQ